MRLRSVFISDVHLGFRGCQADKLLRFLKGVRTDHLFLVGDIIDLWSLKKQFYWPQSHSEVLRTALGKAHDGTQVIYIPGNHDALFRELSGSIFGNIEIHRQFLHKTADGRRLFICHGDEFDGAVKIHPALARIGGAIYDLLIDLDPLANRIRQLFGLDPFSLAAALKTSTPRARRYIENFEEAAVDVSRRHGVDGIVCGHLHQPRRRQSGGCLYLNDGDWVESCTALVEQHDGTLSLLQWTDIERLLDAPAAAPVVTPLRAAPRAA